MKTHFLYLLLLTVSLQALSQTDKGRMLVGGSADVSWSGTGDKKQKTDVRRFNMALTPTFGYFVIKNLAIGGRYSFGVNTVRQWDKDEEKYRAVSTFTTAIGPFAKYYIGKKQIKGMITANVSYSILTRLNRGNVENKNGLLAGGAAGMAYFFNKNIGLETSVYLNTTAYQGDFPVVRGGIAVGFVMLIDRKKDETEIPNTGEQR